MKRLAWTTLILLTVAAGCASSPGVVQLSPDTYMISKEDHAGIFGSLAKLKADTIREANEFAARQGKIAIPISSKEKPVSRRPADWATFAYQFRVVDKNDPEARRTALDASTAATQMGEVTIESSVANAEVYLDGKFVGSAPLQHYPITAGMHAIEVRAPGYQAWRRELSVAAASPTRVAAQLAPDAPRQ
jgi:PEGA domain